MLCSVQSCAWQCHVCSVTTAGGAVIATSIVTWIDLYPAGAYPGHTAKRGHLLPWDSWQQNQDCNVSGRSWGDRDQSANPTQLGRCALGFTGVAGQQQSSNSARN